MYTKKQRRVEELEAKLAKMEHELHQLKNPNSEQISDSQLEKPQADQDEEGKKE